MNQFLYSENSNVEPSLTKQILEKTFKVNLVRIGSSKLTDRGSVHSVKTKYYKLSTTDPKLIGSLKMFNLE